MPTWNREGLCLLDPQSLSLYDLSTNPKSTLQGFICSAVEFEAAINSEFFAAKQRCMDGLSPDNRAPQNTELIGLGSGIYG
ncbi:hypothetical protein Nepgr_013043 [Nepenthes gracilis]|uniref:Uncharacterized protein n=1 Tax=Nepenthes gracilis TaxID=150966 RepID=A0AAD3XNB3_NEPGR|nr:hypothetical protein Nepgr_013043 [Nepenthes gracilis]